MSLVYQDILDIQRIPYGGEQCCWRNVREYMKEVETFTIDNFIQRSWC